MSLVGRVEVGPSPGQQALEAVPEMVLRVEDIRATADEPWRFIFWASEGDFDRYEAALEADPTVASFKCLTELPERRLYRIVLSEADHERSLHPITIEQDITIVSLTITADGEEVLARFPSREALFTYRDACRELGRNFELRNLYEETPDEDREGTGRFGVTEAQREALAHALAAGYFAVPRETTMEAMAADLGVSTAALSTRLRRGQRALLRHTVAADGI
jgi:predicted DNA binding protein